MVTFTLAARSTRVNASRGIAAGLSVLAVACGGVATTVVPATPHAQSAEPTTLIASGPLVEAAPELRCEPNIFAGGYSDAERIDSWLEQENLGAGDVAEDPETPSIEAFRV